MGGIAGAIGTIAGAAIEANASKKAAKQQAAAAQASLDLQRDIFESTEANQAPFIEGGQLALDALLFELGLGDAPEFGGTSQFTVGERNFETRSEADTFLQSERERFARVNAPKPQIEINEKDGGFRVLSAEPFPATFDTSQFGGVDPFGLSVVDNSTAGQTFQGFQESPGFKFAKQQGISAVDASAAAGGNLFSGSTLQALTEFGQGFASQERGAFLNRLSNLTGGGQTAVGQLGLSAASFGTGAASALAGLGNAQSAGTIGVANAFTGGLNSLATQAGAFDFGGFFGGGATGGAAAPVFSPIPTPSPF